MAVVPLRKVQAVAVRVAAFVLLACAAVGASSAPVADLSAASGGLWHDVAQPDVQPAAGARWIVPERYRLVALDRDVLRDVAFNAPMEFTEAARTSPVVITLPMPDGGAARFAIAETQVMAPELAAKFPEIRTWAGQGIDDPTATVRLDWTPQGFHAMVLSPTTGRVFIDPYSRDDTVLYISYFTRDHLSPGRPGFFESPPIDAGGQMTAHIKSLIATSPQLVTGTQLRTYRLALAATGEYTAFFGGTVAAAHSAIVTAVNRVTGIYEIEVAVRLQLVANNDNLIYTNAATDPYTNNNGSTMLGENQTNVDNVIGNTNYDIGHVFSTGGGGIAALGVPCRTGVKAQGVTGSPAPTGDAFWVDYVAHEMGHQFGGNHSFNGTVSNCGGGNRNGATAYEPGSGSTIMAYAGICGSENLQPNSDPYFHTVNFEEIAAYTTNGSGNSCPAKTTTGNNPPVPTVPSGGFTIPSRTPFALTGSATDPDGDALTYNWEEYDLGGTGANAITDPTIAPFFRSWNATTSPTRTFPRLSDLLANTTIIGEKLPNVTRALNFRMTVRDNRAGGGGVAWGLVTFNVTTAAGPFQVTAPNSAVTWAGGSSQTVTWNVANTTAAPVSCANVDIRLSTDGGLTFPTVLLAATPNDGTQAVTLPNVATTTARIKVACSSSVFFDVSDANFTITAAAGPSVTTGAASAIAQTGATLNGTVSSNGQSTTVTFQYGTTTGYGSTATAAQSPLAAGASGAAVSAAITGLTCNTLYHFRAVGANGGGTTNGSDATFTTAACPPPANTTTGIASSANPSTSGAPVTFTATVTGVAPTGTVGFKDGAASIGGCTAAPLAGSGNIRTATCTTSALAVGTHGITAAYGGDSGNNPSTSPPLSQVVAGTGPGIATIITNPYGTITVQGATLNGNTISNFQPNAVIQLGTNPGAPGVAAEIDWQGLNLGTGISLTIRSGAAGQTLLMKDTSGNASALAGTLLAQGGNGAAPPYLYVANPAGFAIAASGSVQSPSGLTVDALGATWTVGQSIVNAGVVAGGPQLQLRGANVKGGGMYKGDAIGLATFGSANNPVNGNYFLSNGLQLYPGTGGNVDLTLNLYGSAPQFVNVKINGNGTAWMPSSWPIGVTAPQNNNPLAPGAIRPPGTPEPAFGGGSMIVQATGSLALVNGGTNDFVFPGAIVLKAEGTLDMNGVLVNQGWTVTGKQFQGIFLESPDIVSPAGLIQLYSNYPNWVNFSTMPKQYVRAFSLAANPDGSAGFFAADAIIPHLNTYSVSVNLAASGGCWTCAINTQPIDVYGP